MKSKLSIIGLVTVFSLVFCTGIVSDTLAAGKYKDYPVPQECMDQVRKEGNKLFVYNWAEYYPQELYKSFEKEFGIKIVEDYYADADEMATKFKLNPKTPYDLVFGGGIRHSVKLNLMGLVRQLNHDWLPNVDAYLMDEFKNMAFDPGNRFQIPGYRYHVVYAYNSKYVDSNDPLVGSWKLLFELPEKYRGKLTMLDNYFNVIGAALKYLGYSYTSDNEKELMEARDVLLKQKPYVMAYDSWPKRILAEEEAWITQSWTGDMWYISREVPTMRNILPKEGSYWAVESNFIPIGAKHPAAAHLFFNYLFRTEMNAMVIEWVGYPPAHKHVMELMSDEMKAWPGFIVSEEYMKKCDAFDLRAITGKGDELRAKIWQELRK